MTQYISYIRVSTNKQGSSGLGLEAQQAAITAFLKGGSVMAEYVEVESGRKNDRPQLHEALAHAKREDATLVIAKLDRLARDVHFISGLMKTGVEFVACDIPYANSLTLHVIAAVAEYEAKLISERTIAALMAAKARGVKLGTPNPYAGVEARRVTARARNAEAMAFAKAAREAGKSLRVIAQELKVAGIKASEGGFEWQATQVARLLKM